MKPSSDFTSAVSDERDARGGWCKGAYTCVCKTCGSSYFGDKRSYSCADCAYSATPTTPSSEGGDGWQGIASAPKDGTIILCYGDVAGEFYGVYAAKMIFPCQFWGKSDYSGFEWIVPETDYAAMWMAPSHWQPLPTPPSEIKP